MLSSDDWISTSSTSARDFSLGVAPMVSLKEMDVVRRGDGNRKLLDGRRSLRLFLSEEVFPQLFVPDQNVDALWASQAMRI